MAARSPSSASQSSSSRRAQRCGGSLDAPARAADPGDQALGWAEAPPGGGPESAIAPLAAHAPGPTASTVRVEGRSPPRASHGTFRRCGPPQWSGDDLRRGAVGARWSPTFAAAVARGDGAAAAWTSIRRAVAHAVERLATLPCVVVGGGRLAPSSDRSWPSSSTWSRRDRRRARRHRRHVRAHARSRRWRSPCTCCGGWRRTTSPTGWSPESALYSALQAGPEHRAWRAATPCRRRDDDDRRPRRPRVRVERSGDELRVHARSVPRSATPSTSACATSCSPRSPSPRRTRRCEVVLRGDGPDVLRRRGPGRVRHRTRPGHRAPHPTATQHRCGARTASPPGPPSSCTAPAPAPVWSWRRSPVGSWPTPTTTFGPPRAGDGSGPRRRWHGEPPAPDRPAPHGVAGAHRRGRSTRRPRVRGASSTRSPYSDTARHVLTS